MVTCCLGFAPKDADVPPPTPPLPPKSLAPVPDSSHRRLLPLISLEVSISDHNKVDNNMINNNQLINSMCLFVRF